MNIKEKVAEIQKGMGTLVKDSKAYNYKYVKLEQIQEKMNPLLEKHKLVLTQPLKVTDGRTILCTFLESFGDNEKAEAIESHIILPDNVKPQDMGSAITYYRRYSLLALFNLMTEDDDGKQAQDSRPIKVPYEKVADRKARVEATQKAKDAGEPPF